MEVVVEHLVFRVQLVAVLSLDDLAAAAIRKADHSAIQEMEMVFDSQDQVVVVADEADGAGVAVVAGVVADVADVVVAGAVVAGVGAAVVADGVGAGAGAVVVDAAVVVAAAAAIELV